ncbi:DUF3024 domain-containing protein [Vibrio salinus]|uniref:DUF3024 domain-containing protein n=1 Tax=Vibrio salinus TaxID=2899784 RepID=UPI001E4D235C|nr:DUF3024 domain-containing protein [Vibrio salinus]MCE0495577.1 DUF3024 domain-containing protein [Vibrio salinus]
MTVINLMQRQIEHRAELLCQNRNKGLPVGIGKCCYEPVKNGVQFIKHHYKLDSSHSDYSTLVARIIWDEPLKSWCLNVPHEKEGEWIPYPFLSQSDDLTAIIREIEKDPKSMFWNR